MSNSSNDVETSTNYDSLVYLNLNRIKSLLEIGVASGHTTKLILKNRHLKLDKFEGIDPHIPYDEKLNEDKIKSAKQKYLNVIENTIVKYHNDYSINVLSEFICQKNYFDCIIVDGCHLARNVFEDLALAFNLLNKKGYLIIDDYWFYPNPKPKMRDISYNSFKETPIHRRCKEVIDLFLQAYKPKIRKVATKNKYTVVVQKMSD